MTRLEDLTPGAVVHGLVPGETVTVVAAVLGWVAQCCAHVPDFDGEGG